MTEKEIRERIADLTKQLDEERAKNAKLTEAVRDLAKGATGVPYVAPPWPIPVPLPPQKPPRLPPGVYAYMCPFPNEGTTIRRFVSITINSDTPKGNEP